MIKKVFYALALVLIIYYRLIIINSVYYAMRAALAMLCLLTLTISNPIIKPLSTFINKQRALNTLYQTNQHLKATNKDLERQLIQTRSLLYAAKVTQPLAEYRERYECSLIGAHVIGRTLSDHIQIMLLNKGSAHGVTKDMIGIWYNYCIGKIYEVNPYSSTLLLITDRRCTVPGLAVESGAHGMVRGLNKQACSFEYVEHTKTLEAGMNIITSGEGTIFPQGFGIGKLSTAIKRSLYYETFIDMPYNAQEIEYCYLGLKAIIEGGM